MRRTILVDADGLPYLAGGAGAKRVYTAVFEDKDGNLSEIKVGSAAEVKEHGKEHKLTLVDRELEIIPQPLAYALQICKQKINEIQERYPFGVLQIYIKGDGTNWRDDIATIHKYKGNRDGVEKPPWNKEIYQYLRDQWNAVEISGKEVDDHLATLAYESSSAYVICTPDKDLDQIVGEHWNYSKNVGYMIAPDEAHAFFWQQALSGDNADNIKGCWKIGVGKAENLVNEWIEDGLDDAEIWEQIVNQYEVSQTLKGCPYMDKHPQVVALENARLVWMQTQAGRLWTPPGRPYEYLEATLDD
jgi:hypothetical protein